MRKVSHHSLGDWLNQRDLLASLSWAIFLSIFFFAIYGTCNAITAGRSDIGLVGFAWERFTPFVPLMILPYMSIDLFFFFAPFVCAGLRERGIHARRVMLAIIIAGVCFLLFPMRMSAVRPAPSGLLGPIFKFLYGFDRPFNLVPSLHIALICVLWAIYLPHTRGIVRKAVGVWFLLIGVSALLTWQHRVLDVFTGLFLGLFCVHLYPASEDQVQNRAGNVRVARRCGAGAAAFCVMALLMRPWGLPLIWPGASLAVMARAYGGCGAAVFLKRDGRLPLSTYIVLGPYLLGIHCAQLIRRRRDEPFTQVVPGLFVGGKLNPVEARALIDRGLCAVLDLTAEFREAGPLRRVTYRNIPILDLTPPTLAQLADATAFIEEHIADGIVYVHCAWGYSRSPCAAAAWLLSTGKAQTVTDAVAVMRSVRPNIVMNPDFMQALQNCPIAHGAASSACGI